MEDTRYMRKYLKYKTKYMQLKQLQSGGDGKIQVTQSKYIGIIPPSGLPFDKLTVPSHLIEALNELYNSIRNSYSALECCFSNFDKKYKYLGALQRANIINTEISKVNKPNALQAKFSDYIDIKPKYNVGTAIISSNKKELYIEAEKDILLSKLIQFMEIVVKIYSNMINRNNEFFKRKNVISTITIRGNLPTHSIEDIWRVYEVKYKEYVDEIFKRCGEFIDGINENIIKNGNIPYFKIKISKIDGACDRSIESDCPFFVLFQRLTRIILPLNEIINIIKKTKPISEQLTKFNEHVTNLRSIVSKLNKLQADIEKHNNKFGADILEVIELPMDTVSKSIHHCEVCNNSEDMKQCCIGDCKVSGVLWKKCEYVPKN